MDLATQAAAENTRLFGVPHPVAFVTGSGAARVGRCIATHFLQRGFDLVLHAHRSVEPAREFQQEVARQGRRSVLVIGDVSDEATVRNWERQAIETLGRVDVVVNSAAVWNPKPLEETTAADYEEQWRINTLGTALVTQHFGLRMVQQVYGGAVINIADWALERPYQNFAAYHASKSAVVTLTKTLAIELANRNPHIRVNAILPGPVLLADSTTEARQQEIAADCLLKRLGTADDVAAAAVFLATSPFITGVCLPVDGGRTIYAGPSADVVAHPDA